MIPALAVFAVVVIPDIAGAPDQPAVADAPLDPPNRAALGWLVDNATRDQQLLVDDVLSAGLLSAGWNRVDVFEFDDPSVETDSTSAVTDADYIVTTIETRALEVTMPELGEAIENSVVVASFGVGAQAVEVRRLIGGAVPASVIEQEASATRTRFGVELAKNPAVRVSDADRGLLVEGRVDPRVVVVLAALAAQGDVTVAGFPVVDGEQERPTRQVAITDLGGTALVADGQATPEASDLIDGLLGRYAPLDVWVDAGSLVLRYPLSLDPLAD